MYYSLYIVMLVVITDFHPNDIIRVKNDDLWLRRFVAHAESNMDTAVTLLYECCVWRKEFGTNGTFFFSHSTFSIKLRFPLSLLLLLYV